MEHLLSLKSPNFIPKSLKSKNPIDEFVKNPNSHTLSTLRSLVKITKSTVYDLNCFLNMVNHPPHVTNPETGKTKRKNFTKAKYKAAIESAIANLEGFFKENQVY